MKRIIGAGAPAVLALSVALIAPVGFIPAVMAADANPPVPPKVIEEMIVTARQKNETLQDVPVTITAFSENDLDRYNVTNLIEASTLVPNLLIFQGGSGNGSNLYLRGVGSSSISAAFDQSIALNLDGVVVNIGRFIFNSYIDMKQIEVLKGPQSLYFGKSATAGVITVATNDPGDHFELSGQLGYENEHDQTTSEFLISGPLTDTLGARLVVGTRNSDKLYENKHPRAANHWRGEDSQDSRLTLKWKPTERFSARLKTTFSRFDSDGSNASTENICPDGMVQPTVALGGSVVRNNIDNCKKNDDSFIADLDPRLSKKLPHGNNGVPYLEQQSHLYGLTANYDVTDTLAITSVSSLVDFNHQELDIYDYSSGIFGGLHKNTYKSYSQEFRLSSAFKAPVNFQVGLYGQKIKQEFHAFQYAANLGLIAPDPITGNTYDYNKNHFLDTKVYSGFAAVYWDITDALQLTAGARYTKEKKDGHITLPYVHAFFGAAFLKSGARIDGLKFDDSNLSPEVALNWHITDEISVFAAYKQGFKSGGVDNSALPTNSLSPTNPNFPQFLIYQSEEAKGEEIGVKSRFLDEAVRLNATIFHYVYSDLQTQQFDSLAIQFRTFNASELTTQGFETDLLWETPLKGLSTHAALAYTDASYTKDFININGANLKNEDLALSAKYTGNVGVNYDMAAPMLPGWRLNASVDMRYTDDYRLSNQLNTDVQDSFWLANAAVRLSSENGKYEFAFIGRNLTNAIYGQGEGPRPGARPFAGGKGKGRQDQVVTTATGREWTLQAKIHL